MTKLSKLKVGDLLRDSRTGQFDQVDRIEIHGQVVFLSFKHPQTGAIDRQPFTLAEAESRFEVVDEQAVAFRANPEIVSLVAEAYRLQHAYLFNPLFATETSLIDLLPHQLAAVYGVPPTPGDADARPGMLDLPRIRFLLADDAGAGKTIMVGLLIRELLLRRVVRRVLVVPPAGLVGNWERELRILFRLRFRTLSGLLFNDDTNPFADPRNDLAIISVDTLWRDKARKAYIDAAPEVKRREDAEGSSWEDVSDPHRKAGFDLKVTRADGSVRYVEVKGRSGRQAVELTENEWAQAANHRDRYWLYVVYDCDTMPDLYPVPDPFGSLLARQTGAIRITASQIIAAAQAGADTQ